MSKSKFTLIYYIVPEDLDQEEEPNVFGLIESIN